MPYTTNVSRLGEKKNSNVGFDECVVSVAYFISFFTLVRSRF